MSIYKEGDRVITDDPAGGVNIDPQPGYIESVSVIDGTEPGSYGNVWTPLAGGVDKITVDVTDASTANGIRINFVRQHVSAPFPPSDFPAGIVRQVSGERCQVALDGWPSPIWYNDTQLTPE